MGLSDDLHYLTKSSEHVAKAYRNELCNGINKLPTMVLWSDIRDQPHEELFSFCMEARQQSPVITRLHLRPFLRGELAQVVVVANKRWIEDWYMGFEVVEQEDGHLGVKHN